MKKQMDDSARHNKWLFYQSNQDKCKKDHRNVNGRYRGDRDWNLVMCWLKGEVTAKFQELPRNPIDWHLQVDVLYSKPVVALGDPTLIILTDVQDTMLHVK